MRLNEVIGWIAWAVYFTIEGIHMGMDFDLKFGARPKLFRSRPHAVSRAAQELQTRGDHRFLDSINSPPRRLPIPDLSSLKIRSAGYLSGHVKSNAKMNVFAFLNI